MIDILKMLPRSLIKSGMKNVDLSDSKSCKYLYMTLICMFIYTLNKYKSCKNKTSSYCHSCGSHSNNCSCSSSSCSPHPPCPPTPPCPPHPPCPSPHCPSSECESSCEKSCDYTRSEKSCDYSRSEKSCEESCSYSCDEKSCGGCNSCKKNCGEPYPLCLEDVCKNYENCRCLVPCYTSIIVNENHLCIPQFNLRTLPGCINFFYNFYVGNLSNSSINSLIMLKDLLTWRSGGGISIGSDILPDCIYPVYFIYKEKSGNVCCYEYLKIFINTDDCNMRTAFVSKGKDYLCVVDKINFLLVGCDDCPFIGDLLNGSEYYTYNISETCPQTLLGFIYALLSLYLIPNCLIGKQIIYDISYCNETQKQYDYFFEYFNCECNPSTMM